MGVLSWIIMRFIEQPLFLFGSPTEKNILKPGHKYLSATSPDTIRITYINGHPSAY
jgi:hypothetical protein